MKMVFARIGMYLDIPNEEAAELRADAGTDEAGDNYEYDIPVALAKRFVRYGDVSDESYIPAGCIER